MPQTQLYGRVNWPTGGTNQGLLAGVQLANQALQEGQELGLDQREFATERADLAEAKANQENYNKMFNELFQGTSGSEIDDFWMKDPNQGVVPGQPGPGDPNAMMLNPAIYDTDPLSQQDVYAKMEELGLLDQFDITESMDKLSLLDKLGKKTMLSRITREMGDEGVADVGQELYDDPRFRSWWEQGMGPITQGSIMNEAYENRLAQGKKPEDIKTQEDYDLMTTDNRNQFLGTMQTKLEEDFPDVYKINLGKSAASLAVPLGLNPVVPTGGVPYREMFGKQIGEVVDGYIFTGYATKRQGALGTDDAVYMSPNGKYYRRTGRGFEPL